MYVYSMLFRVNNMLQPSSRIAQQFGFDPESISIEQLIGAAKSYPEYSRSYIQFMTFACEACLLVPVQDISCHGFYYVNSTDCLYLTSSQPRQALPIDCRIVGGVHVDNRKALGRLHGYLKPEDGRRFPDAFWGS